MHPLIKKHKIIFISLGIVFIAGAVISNLSCKHEPYIPDNIETLCYDKDIKPIFMSNCAYAGCHDPITMEKDYDFSTYQGIISSGALNIGDPDDSKIYKAINDLGDDLMPPPPKPKLSANNIGLIYLWIKQGAIEKCD